ncbi:GNAT family N-acetyltransferase [Candidatus Leptofilum sp.]|uniref:GNAT family N-acetyltransferase n=1 Tax=Candidatus Leptofilum sp. TaxID=3241576 RepID=UPI003B5921A4
MSDYFNYQLHTAVSHWDRRTFLRYSRQIYGRDNRWTPPDAHYIHTLLNPAKQPHLARMQPRLHYFDGLRQRNQQSVTTRPALANFETPLVTNILLHDPRRHDRTAYLAYLHCTNNKAAFLAYQDNIIEGLVNRGIRRLLGPVSLLPQLGSGALVSHWQQQPPQHTPYNPPYLPEVLARRMRPIAQATLFSCIVPTTALTNMPQHPAMLRPLNPAQLSGVLLPLLVMLCQNPAGFPTPDDLEAAYWQRWLGPQLRGWVAWIDEQPVGLVLLLPDLAARLRRFRGGRGMWGLGLTAVRHRTVSAGRVLLGGVHPAWRVQGIGRQLWQQTIQSAQAAGWQKITIGPVWEGGTAVPFLHHHKAITQQTYQLYERTF